MTPEDQQFIDSLNTKFNDPESCTCPACQMKRGEIPPLSEETTAIFGVQLGKLCFMLEQWIPAMSSENQIANQLIAMQLTAYMHGVEAARKEKG